MAAVPAATVITRISNFGSCHKWGRKMADIDNKWGKGFGKRAAQPHPIFLGVPHRVFSKPTNETT